jgi:minor histocompatibility antigen H13
MEINLIVAYTALCIMAVLPIYYGSFATIKWPKKHKTRPPSATPESNSSSEEESATESLSTNDAVLFPLIGSGVLFGLYVIFQLFSKEYINYLVSIYFAFFGVAATTTAGVYVVKNAIGIKVEPYKIVVTRKAKVIHKRSFTTVHLGVAVASVFLTAYYVLTKNWIASNVLGLSFAFNGIQILALDTFMTGIYLLAGLFIYDIFWVFGTDVMVTVAKSFDAPIKVLWPKSLFGLGSGSTTEATQFTMLGLGDIVIPGIFVALCLRLDHFIYLKQNPNAHRNSKYPTPYFHSCFASYILGLVTTIVVMHTFQAAQPALLYLSPACIFSVLITGLAKNQLKAVFEFSSQTEKNDEQAGKADTAKKSKDNERRKKKKKNIKASQVAKTESSSDAGDEDVSKDNQLKPSDNGDGPGAVTGEEDYVEVTSTRTRRSKRMNKKK